MYLLYLGLPLRLALRIRRSRYVLSPAQPRFAVLLLTAAQSSYCWQQKNASWLASFDLGWLRCFVPQASGLLCLWSSVERLRCPLSPATDSGTLLEPPLPFCPGFDPPTPPSCFHNFALFPWALSFVLHWKKKRSLSPQNYEIKGLYYVCQDEKLCITVEVKLERTNTPKCNNISVNHFFVFCSYLFSISFTFSPFLCTGTASLWRSATWSYVRSHESTCLTMACTLQILQGKLH